MNAVLRNYIVSFKFCPKPLLLLLLEEGIQVIIEKQMSLHAPYKSMNSDLNKPVKKNVWHLSRYLKLLKKCVHCARDDSI